MSLDPIVAVVTVPVTATEAFVGFTARMGEWWDPLLTPDAATFTNIAVDPEGVVAMVHGDEHYVWGRVTAWEPPTRYAQDLWLGHAEEAPTTLAVTFEEADGATTLRLEHAGWPDGAAALRETYTRWDDLLARFAAHVS